MENLWRKRFIALLIDIIVILLIVWVLSAFIYPLIAMVDMYEILNYWLILTVLIIMGYFTYLEGKFGTTLGKNIIRIKVVADNGDMNYRKAFLRNLSKILWFPLIVDIIAGYATGNSKIRYLDKIAGTNVTGVTIENKKQSESLAEPESAV